MRILGLLVLASTCVLGSMGIYPEDHWNHSTKLTKDNFDVTVQSEIDAGRTFFVRWIASKGWGWWQDQAPGWNTIIREFAGKEKVSFGDVNLSEESIRGPPHNPGSGGWPTIRYFNKATGPEGGSYTQKNDGPICEELKDPDNMRAYVEEYGVSCSVADNDGCDDREVTYISKMKALSADDKTKALVRLYPMSILKLKSDLLAWVKKRIDILEQLVAADGIETEL